MEERHEKLLQLKQQLQQQVNSLSELNALQVYFIGINTTGCKCKAPNVKRNLQEFWNNQGAAQLDAYENPPQIGSTGIVDNND